MIAVSTVVMFGLTYLNTSSGAHVRFSETRLYMAPILGSDMAAIMLLFMLGMYRNRRLNIAILAACAAVFLGSLFLVRSQRLVGDVAYMEAMIPHHSIAELTSERARIRDPRVRQLADAIIRTQVREIAEMNRLAAELRRNPPPRGGPVIPPGAGALP